MPRVLFRNKNDTDNSSSYGGPSPDLPQATVDVTMPTTTTTVNVSVGNLQSAINAAALGTKLVLEAGSTHPGTLTLPYKTGSGWIVITTNSETLPAEGTRVGPSDAGHMAKVTSGASSQAAFQTDTAAHHFRFVGIEFAATEAENGGLFRIGSGETTSEDLPHHLVFDRTYLHGHATLGGKRGVAGNGNSIAVIESHFSDWYVAGQDTQALCTWNGEGPFLLRNSYFDAASENVMFGGADASIENLVPSDITIVNNLFYKPLVWRGDPDMSVKNLFELKNARRVLFDHNIFENNWADAQTGTAINFKSENSGGTMPWATCEHVTFQYNIVRHAGSAVVIATSGYLPSQAVNNFLFYRNNFEDISSVNWGGDGLFFLLLGPQHDVTVDSNWADTDGLVLGADGVPMNGLVFTNNMVRHNDYGVKGSGTGIGLPTLEYWFPGYVFTGNQLAGGVAYEESYPPGNTFPASLPPEPPL